jgi:hypothetical protein
VIVHRDEGPTVADVLDEVRAIRDQIDLHVSALLNELIPVPTT